MYPRMILNVYGRTEQNQLIVDMPNIALDRRYRYQIGVHRVYFEIENSGIIQLLRGNNDLLMISSNLVDRSAINPQQSIVYFDFSKRDKLMQSFCSLRVIFQPLQMYELANASFSVCLLNGQPVDVIFKQLFLQLEIKRSENYGWFQ